MKRAIGLIVAVLACSAVQSENYYSASVTKFDTNDGDLELHAITVTYGTVLSESVSGELRFGLGVDDQTYNEYTGYDYYDVGVVEIDYSLGAYLKFSPASGEIIPYAIFGLTKLKANSEGYTYRDGYYGVSDINYYSSSVSEDDISLGLGIDFANGFNIEYMQYIDKGGLELNGLSLGMKF